MPRAGRRGGRSGESSPSSRAARRRVRSAPDRARDRRGTNRTRVALTPSIIPLIERYLWEAQRPFGKVIVAGAISGLPTSSWICACLRSGMSRGFPVKTWPLKNAVTRPFSGPTRFRPERLVPDVEEVTERVGLRGRRLDVDDPVARVSVQPRETAAAGDEVAVGCLRHCSRRRDPDPVRDRSAQRRRRTRSGARGCGSRVCSTGPHSIPSTLCPSGTYPAGASDSARGIGTPSGPVGPGGGAG